MLKDVEYLESVYSMIHAICNRHFPTFPHDDLFQQGVVIALEQKDNYDVRRGAKLSSWLYTQLRGRLDKYIKKNMIPISVPHNVTPDWSFGDADQIEELAYTNDIDDEEWKERRDREDKEDKILAKAKLKLNNEDQEIMTDMVLRGHTYPEINTYLGKKPHWCKGAIISIEKKLSSHS